MTRSPRRARVVVVARLRGDTGTGGFGTWFGVIVFLFLLLFSVQTLTNLYANSVVTSEAYAAVRTVAGHEANDDRAAAADSASERFRANLGRAGDDAELVFLDLTDPDVIRARVTARHRRLLPSLMGAVLFGEVDRVIEVRVERIR